MSKDGGPAFPTPVSDGGVDAHGGVYFPGMSLRDYFAAKAVAGMLMSGDYVGFVETDDYLHLAGHAYRLADAMLIARATGSES